MHSGYIWIHLTTAEVSVAYATRRHTEFSRFTTQEVIGETRKEMTKPEEVKSSLADETASSESLMKRMGAWLIRFGFFMIIGGVCVVVMRTTDAWLGADFKGIPVIKVGIYKFVHIAIGAILCYIAHKLKI